MDITHIDFFAFDNAFRYLYGYIAADTADFTLQVANASFTGVMVDDFMQGTLGDTALFCIQAIGLHLTFDQVTFGNLCFFLLCVARQLDHFHTVTKRTRNGIRHIGRADKHDAGQIKRH